MVEKTLNHKPWWRELYSRSGEGESGGGIGDSHASGVAWDWEVNGVRWRLRRN